MRPSHWLRTVEFSSSAQIQTRTSRALWSTRTTRPTPRRWCRRRRCSTLARQPKTASSVARYPNATSHATLSSLGRAQISRKSPPGRSKDSHQKPRLEALHSSVVDELLNGAPTPSANGTGKDAKPAVEESGQERKMENIRSRGGGGIDGDTEFNIRLPQSSWHPVTSQGSRIMHALR